MCYIGIIEEELGMISALFCYHGSRHGGNMAREFAKAFYKSRKWEKCKNSFIDRRINIDGGLCEECHENPGYIVHHKILLTADNISNPEVSLNHELLEYVCKSCHDLFDGHGVGKGMRPLCSFDEKGQPISLREIDKLGSPP